MEKIINYFLPWNNIFFNFSKIEWIGKTPDFFLWKKFLKDSKINISKYSKIALLELHELIQIQKTTNYFNGQEIKENKWKEKNLLQASTFIFYPHEVFQINIINKQNINLSSPIYHGTSNKCSSPKELAMIISKLLKRARQQKIMIEEVEVIHTHPSLELIIVDDKKSKFIFNGLSNTDIKTAKLLSKNLDFPLRITAVTPSVNYSILL